LPELQNTFSDNIGSSILTVLDDILVEVDYHGFFLHQIDNGLSIPGISQFNSINYKTSVVGDDDLVCFEAFNIGIFFIDISNPLDPQQAAFYPLDGEVMGMTIRQQILYVSSEQGLLIMDISDPTSPELINTIQPNNDSNFRAPAIVQGNDLIIADAAWNEILVYDISEPGNPVLQSTYSGCRQVREMTLIDEQLFTANFKSGFAIIDMEGSLSTEEILLSVNDFNLTNYPNPFNPETTITFNLTTEITEATEISIYNLRGQKVKTLPVSPSQSHTVSVTWNGADDLEKSVSSGVYFIRLNVGNELKAARKCLLLK
jgi:hypothetical protein